MGEVVPFKKPKLKDKFKGRNLCGHGFHKWVLETQQKFDVKQGRLVTVHICSRCGEKKVTAL